MSVTGSYKEIYVENNTCDKGLEFAKKELINPERILTSTIRVNYGILPLVSIRSDKPVKKKEIKTLIKHLDGIVVSAPIIKDQVLVSELGENKVNILATRSIDKLNILI